MCGAQSRYIPCIGQAGRGQAEHWLQRVPARHVFELIGRQVAEGWMPALALVEQFDVFEHLIAA